MAIPFLLPELGAGEFPMRVSSWFFDPGDHVNAGDRVLEVLTSGLTCDIAAPFSGKLGRIEKGIDDLIRPGDVVAWIEPE